MTVSYCGKIFVLFLVLTLNTSSWLVAAPDFQMPPVKEPVIPNRSVSLLEFGAVGDGKKSNTEEIARAIESLAKQGGGRLVIPPGIWLTGPIRLRSNIELHLEAGALVQFSDDYKQFPLMVLDTKGEKEVQSTSPLLGENLENVAITGSGVIDGAGNAWRPLKKAKITEGEAKSLQGTGWMDPNGTWWPSQQASDGDKVAKRLREEGNLKPEDYEPAHQYLRPRLVKLIGCHKVLLEGVTFQNSPNWTVNPTLCEDLTIRGITSRNAWSAQNTDALDLESCRNVIVRDSTFDVGDDGICLKSGQDAAGRRIGVPTENVLIENNVVYHAHGGFTIGSEMSGGVRNVRVNNCLFMGTDIGLRFKSTRGRGGVVEKIYISNVWMTDIGGDAISFNMYYGGKAPLDAKGQVSSTDQPAVSVTEETPQFRDIHIENIVCRGAKSAVLLEGLPEMPIRGIHMKNVSITSQAGMQWTDAEDISLENVEIANQKGPVLSIFHTKKAMIDHLTYPIGAEAVIDAKGKGNSGIVIKNTDTKAAGTTFIKSDAGDAGAIQIK